MKIPRGDNAKFWILPNGTIENLKDLWHYQWIKQNISKLNKFGLIESELPSGDTDIRLMALSKGFSRMNFGINGGRLTVETNVNKWGRKTRDAIEDFVYDNINRIDFIHIALLDKKGMVKRQGTANWLGIGDEEKRMSIPLITENQDEAIERRQRIMEDCVANV